MVLVMQAACAHDTVLRCQTGSDPERYFFSSHPEGASLAELEHPEHTVLKLHRAVELGQVVVIDAQQLKCEDME